MTTPGTTSDHSPVDRLAATVAQHEDLTERFKSNNALLQNSLSYFGLLSTDPMFSGANAELAPAVGALAAAMFHLARDPSPDAVAALQDISNPDVASLDAELGGASDSSGSGAGSHIESARGQQVGGWWQVRCGRPFGR